jgi:uncharacterized protein YggE
MEQETKITDCCQWKNHKHLLIIIAIFLLAAVSVISILRERIVRDNSNLVTVNGQGKIAYQSDIAIVKIGVQVDKVIKAEEALNKLNEKMNAIISSAKNLGIPEEDIQTQNYSLYPNYEYRPETGNSSIPSGYNANQQVAIKVRNIDKNPELSGKVIEEANKAGANQIIGVTFDVSNLDELKQKARIEAIKDARLKSTGLAKAAGVKNLGKVVSWYENVIVSPDAQRTDYGMGGNGEKSISSAIPQIPGGTEEIIIEMGLNYRVK